MLREFEKFALRGNVVDLAVGFTVGSAFTALVKSLVNDVIMPPIGLLLGDMDFANWFLLFKQGDPAGPYPSLKDAQAANAVTLNAGVFINTIISLLIVSVVMFLLVRAINRLQAKVAAPAPPPAPTTKDCPFCCTAIPLGAVRCPACTSELPPVEQG
jgi:large conductance mechanosensitive channel